MSQLKDQVDNYQTLGKNSTISLDKAGGPINANNIIEFMDFISASNCEWTIIERE